MVIIRTSTGKLLCSGSGLLRWVTSGIPTWRTLSGAEIFISFFSFLPFSRRDENKYLCVQAPVLVNLGKPYCLLFS